MRRMRVAEACLEPPVASFMTSASFPLGGMAAWGRQGWLVFVGGVSAILPARQMARSLLDRLACVARGGSVGVGSVGLGELSASLQPGERGL
jgi:hypothetical protein